VSVVNTPVFLNEEGQVIESTISDGIATSNGDALHFTEAFPQSFDRFVWSPNGGNTGSVSF